MQEKGSKKFLVFQIITYNLVAVNSLFYYENTRNNVLTKLHTATITFMSNFQ